MFHHTMGRRLAALGFALLAFPLYAQTGELPTSPALNAALAKEQIERDLQAALDGYRAIAADANAADALRNRARFRAALIERRLGNAETYRSELKALSQGDGVIAKRAKKLLAEPDEDSERWQALKERALEILSGGYSVNSLRDLMWIGSPAVDACRQVALTSNNGAARQIAFGALWYIEGERSRAAILEISALEYRAEDLVTYFWPQQEDRGSPAHADLLPRVIEQCPPGWPAALNHVRAGALEPESTYRFLSSADRLMRIAAHQGLRARGAAVFRTEAELQPLIAALEAPDPELVRVARKTLASNWWYSQPLRLAGLRFAEDWDDYNWGPTDKGFRFVPKDADPLIEALANAVRRSWNGESVPEALRTICSRVLQRTKADSSPAVAGAILDIAVATKSVWDYLQRHEDALGPKDLVPLVSSSLSPQVAARYVARILDQSNLDETDWELIQQLESLTSREDFLPTAVRTGHPDVASRLLEALASDDPPPDYLVLRYDSLRDDEVSRNVLREMIRRSPKQKNNSTKTPGSRALRRLAEAGATDLPALLDMPSVGQRFDLSVLMRRAASDKEDSKPLPYSDAEFVALWVALIQGPLRGGAGAELWLNRPELRPQIDDTIPTPIVRAILSTLDPANGDDFEFHLLFDYCAQTTTPAEQQTLIRDLQLKSLRAADNPVAALGALPSKLTPPFVEALTNLARRDSAAFAALQDRGLAVSQTFLDKVLSPDIDIRRYWIAKLQNIPGQPTLEVLGRIVDQLLGVPPTDVIASYDLTACIEALGRTLDPKAAPILLRITQERPDFRPDIVRAQLERIRFYREQKAHWDKVLQGTPELGSSRAASKLVEQAGPKQPKAQRLLAIRSLGALGEPASLPFLIEWSSDPDQELATAAALAIERILERG